MRATGRVRSIFILLIWGLLLPSVGLADDYLLPRPRALVNDSAGLLSADEKVRIERMLRGYEDTTSTQIYVVTVRDLQGRDANDFCTTLGNQWGAGQAGLDNGIIVLLRPGKMPPPPSTESDMAALGDSVAQVLSALTGELPEGARGQVLFTDLQQRIADISRDESYASRPAGDYGEGYIAVGYGLESSINDAMAARIVRNVMGPLVVTHNYAAAIEAGARALMEAAAGRFSQTASDEQSEGSQSLGMGILSLIGVLIFLLLIVCGCSVVLCTPVLIIKYIVARSRNTTQESFAHYFFSRQWKYLQVLLLGIVKALAAMLLLAAASGSSSRDGRGGSSSSGGWGGSGGGGGWSGSHSAGGGSFGGAGGGGRF